VERAGIRGIDKTTERGERRESVRERKQRDKRRQMAEDEGQMRAESGEKIEKQEKGDMRNERWYRR